MTGATLPDSEQEFLAQLKTYFPKHWDMKFIMGKKNIHGGLQKVHSPTLHRCLQCLLCTKSTFYPYCAEYLPVVSCSAVAKALRF